MPALLRRPFAAWARLRASDPVAARFVAVLGLVVLLCVLRLAIGDNPWADGVAERLREGKHPRPVDYARTYGWWAAAAIGGLAVGLLATRPLWLVRGDPPEATALRPPDKAGPAFGLLVLGAVVTLGVLAAPRLDHSFWDDELYSLRTAVFGGYVLEPSGELDFDRTRLRDTLWHYHKPSNHVPQSLLSKLSLRVWGAFDDEDEGRFASETATRVPVYVAGLLAVSAAALLLRRMGFPVAGIAVAWLLALHPWQLRYASEARGYALLLLFVPTTLLLLSRAVQLGSWSRWLAYGAAQLVLVWSFPAAVFTLLITNLLALAWILWTQPSAAGRLAQLRRFVLANLLGAMLGLFLMLPNLAQLQIYLARDDLARFDAAKFLPDVLSHLWIGTPWSVSFLSERFVNAQALRDGAPALFWAVLGASIAAAALGAVRLLIGGRRTLPIALALLLPAPVTYAFAWSRETFLNQWYLIFALPSVASLIALGLSWPAEAGRRRGAALAAGGVLVLGYLAAFGVLTQETRASLRALPLQPIRESVERTRAARDPFDDRNRRVLTASFQAPPLYYDPLVRVVSSPRELRSLMRQADEEQLVLFVNYGRPRIAARRYGPLVELLDDPRLFALDAELVGSSPRGVRRVYRYRGAGAR